MDSDCVHDVHSLVVVDSILRLVGGGETESLSKSRFMLVLLLMVYEKRVHICPEDLSEDLSNGPCVCNPINS